MYVGYAVKTVSEMTYNVLSVTLSLYWLCSLLEVYDTTQYNTPTFNVRLKADR